MNKEVIRICLDYGIGPILCKYIDESTMKPITGFSQIDNNSEIQELNLKIRSMYEKYYEFNSHDSACWFNKKLEYEERFEMIALLEQLISLLDSVNDGSFIVKDEETDRLRKMKKDDIDKEE